MTKEQELEHEIRRLKSRQGALLYSLTVMHEIIRQREEKLMEQEIEINKPCFGNIK